MRDECYNIAKEHGFHDVEIEAAKERNERLRKEIREQTNANRCKEERKIKFRGFNAKNNQWLYGSHIINRGKHFVAPDEFADDKTWEDYEVEPATVGQFTGLTDRNGEEIYEGDILAIEGIKYPRHYIVSWNTKKLMFCISDTPLYALLEAGSTTMREYIVCGNIHDNYKLLKDENN